MDGRVADEEEVELAAVDADRHAQHHHARRGAHPADHLQRRPHPVRCPRGALGVVRPLEEQQDGVPAPLHEIGAVVHGLGEQPRERGTEDVAHLLGTDLALAGKALGQPGEAGDVDEGEAAGHTQVPIVRARRRPAEKQPGDVRQQAVDLVRSGGHATASLPASRAREV
jgi:hypothetical protein